MSAITEQVAALVHAHAPEGGLVLDLGCGRTPPAEAIAALGFVYVGCDADPAAVASLLDGGFEAHRVGPNDAGLAKNLVEAVGDRPVSAVLVPDALASAADQAAFLDELGAALADLGNPALVVSVPNAGQFDLSAALATGAAELPSPVGRAGPPARPFTSSGLTAVLGAAGWAEVARADLAFPHDGGRGRSDHPALVAGAPLHDLLWRLRRQAGDDVDVARFVRLFRRARPHEAPSGPDPDEDANSVQPFLTVLVRTQGRRPDSLIEALVCLASQTDSGSEIVVLVHAPDTEPVERTRELVSWFAPEFDRHVRVAHVEGGRRGRPLNEGLRRARGRYVAFLDDDDLVTADWVERFRAGAEEAPGRVIRAITVDRRVRRPQKGEPSVPYVTLSGLERTYADRFDVLEHFSRNRTPICSFAVPLDAVRALGLSFDEEAFVLEDWPFLLQVALVSGVHDTGWVTGVYQRWDGSDSAAATVDAGVWEDAHRGVVAGFDAGPLLLPGGSAGRIATMFEKSRILDHEMPAHNAERAMLADRLADAERLAAEAVRLHEQHVADLEHALAESRRLAEREHAEAKRARSEAEDLRAHADRLHAHAEALRADAEGLRASTSWRLTAPVRGLGAVVRRVREAVSSKARSS